MFVLGSVTSSGEVVEGSQLNTRLCSNVDVLVEEKIPEKKKASSTERCVHDENW